ncbi:unnamed protein product [Eretmochelys imbricata]
MTRKHSVRCLLVPTSPHVETYVWALARVVGPSAIVAASKMYGKVVFFLASEAAAQEAVERGLAVGRVFVPLELLEDLGLRLVLTFVPPFLPSAALLPALSTLGKPVSVISPLPLGCKDPTLRHIFSFRQQVQLLLPSVAIDGEALEGSFLVPHRGACYRVLPLPGVRACPEELPLSPARRGIWDPRDPAGHRPVIADAPGCPIPEPAPPPFRPPLLLFRPKGHLPYNAQMSGRAVPSLLTIWRGLWRRVWQRYHQAWERACPRESRPSLMLPHRSPPKSLSHRLYPLKRPLLTSPQMMPWRAGP